MIRSRNAACLLLALACTGPPASTALAEESWSLDASAWARPRSGSTVVGMAPLPEVVRAWSSAQDRDIAILHAGGEEGELRARELQDWLIALGVPGNRIQLLVGGADPHALRLELRSSEAGE